MVQVVWTRGAASELRAIRAYIAQFSPLAAQRFAARLMSAAQDLETSPDRGRSISRGRRELAIIPPYLIRYVHAGDRVVIFWKFAMLRANPMDSAQHVSRRS